MLRTIAVYKLVKVLLLLALAYGEVAPARRLAHGEAAVLGLGAAAWARTRRGDAVAGVVQRLERSRIHALRIVTLAYAAVFAVEGVGLWMQKRWAEWLTVIITASLIPLEVWELIHRPTIGKAAVLVANSAIVAYLAWHVVRSRAKHQKS